MNLNPNHSNSAPGTSDEVETATACDPCSGSAGMSWIGWGTLCWVLFCLAAVLVRGVRWDETFEHAQIISGQVPYPEGHPLRVYVLGAFSLQTYLSAALLYLGSGPALLCGLRNCLFLLGTVLPVYCLAALLTRRALWGHAAALLLLEGILLEFDGSYPTFVWPELFSNGHIGGAFALLTLAALLAGRLRLAFFLFGLMPCIHVGQWPVLLGLFPLYALWTLWQGRGRVVLRALPFLGAGLAVCVGFYVIQRGFVEPPATRGPFFCEGDPAPVWQGYTARHDPHRQFPPGNGHVLLLGTLLLTALAAWRSQPGPLRETYGWLFVYTFGVAAAVWGTMLIHSLMGSAIPFVLIAWMPYRLINHIPALCLAAVVGILYRRQTGPAALMLAGALLWGLLHPFLGPLMHTAFYSRYVAVGDCVAFGLYGAALVALVPTRARVRAWLPLLVAVLALAGYHQFGAACVLAGACVGWVLARMEERRPVQLLGRPVVLGMVCILTVAVLLGHQWRYRQWLPLSAFDRELAARLVQAGEPDALLVARPNEYLLQARTGHPVLVEVATPSLISYLPDIGPAIDRIYRDLYGISFALEAEDGAVSWGTLWAQRSASEWQALASRYGFRYVVAPPELGLALPKVFGDGSNTLYEVP